MYSRQSPGRNLRSKRLKTRHVLQISLLLVVSFWLIYQLHHSHDKKKEFDEGDDVKASLESDEFLRLGRKDIRPLVEETGDKIARHVEESVEEDENKLEEDDAEESKIEHNDAIERKNEETNEDKQEKSDSEEFADDEKEKEEKSDNNNVAEETDSVTEKHRLEKEDSAEESDPDGLDKSAHEAREEHYKADDASSAVSQGTQEKKTSPKNENQHPRDPLEVEDNNGSDGEEADDFQNGKDSNVETAKISEKVEFLLDNSENDSPPNETTTRGSEENLTEYNSTNVARENMGSSSVNVTESLLHDGNNSLVSNSTGQVETRDAESKTGHGGETIITSEASAGTVYNGIEASMENNDVTDEGSDTSNNNNAIEENFESKDSENNRDEGEGDAIDISDSNDPSEEETNIRTDLDILPVIDQRERTSGDDEGAAE